MKKTKIIIVLLLLITMINIIFNKPCFATIELLDDPGGGSVITQFGRKLQWSYTGSDKIRQIAVKILSVVRNIAAWSAVIVLSIIGVKYIAGSAEQKAGYKKALIPLTVGILLVAGAIEIVIVFLTIGAKMR